MYNGLTNAGEHTLYFSADENHTEQWLRFRRKVQSHFKDIVIFGALKERPRHGI